MRTIAITALAACASLASAASAQTAYTPADVKFMQGMIHHHAQAVTMSQWAPAHGASAQLRTLAERIDVGQRDEIATMERWLRDHHEPLPMTDMHDMPGMQMPMMPGMLTPAQMKELDAARGADFDRLFLTFMIQHHQGALQMVKDLYASPGAGQESQIFRFASDVVADQTAEIERMQKMLAALPRSSR